MRVIVVGAGFAGLACAEELMRRGHDVIVFEARDRVGGRVWSQQLVPGDDATVIERGAEFVLDGYDTLRAYAGRFGLTIAPTGMSYYVREPRGTSAPISAEQVAAAATSLRPAAQSASSRTPLSDFLAAQHDVPIAAREALAARAAISWAADENELSAHVLLDDIASVQPKPTARIAGGNQGIALGLAQALGDRIRLREPVTAVRELPDGVEAVTPSGVATGDVAVLAIPLPLLERLPITPSLPQEQREAMTRMVRGHAAKLHIPLTRAATPSAVLDARCRFWCWTATDASGRTQPVLHCFSGSRGALSGLAVVEGPTAWAAHARSLRPDLDLAHDRAVITTWDDDPWATFAYSGLGASSLPEDDQVIGRAHGRIHVAGEHTAGEWSGLMEGALRSGVRAAQQVDALREPAMSIS